MPNKNKQNKPNGFVIFANEARDELVKNGHKIRTMQDLITAASPKWTTLPYEEKEYYKERAKWEWDNRNGNGSTFRKKPVRPNTNDSGGDPGDMVKMNEEKRERERREVFWSMPSGRAVLNKNFYFVSFICLLEQPKYQPIEIAAVEFNLLNGVVRNWHKFIDPGPIEVGYQYLAQQLSEDTHKIPVEGIAMRGDTYASVYDELISFISSGTTLIPPIHVKTNECDKVEGCIKWLAKMAGRPHQVKRVYELEGLILDLDHHLKGQPQDFLQSYANATALISSTIFDWDSESQCQYHEENETLHCARGNVFKYCYLMADYFCSNFQIPVTNGHKPAEAEKRYTFIKSDANKARERQEQQTLDCSADEVAVSVSEKLNVGDNNEMDRFDELKRRLYPDIAEENIWEENKKWQSSKRKGNEQDSSSTSTSTAVPMKTPKAAMGRGRGRGKSPTSQTLRQPGIGNLLEEMQHDKESVKAKPIGRGAWVTRFKAN